MEKTEGKKTVIVIDEQGKIYESTYPKRAKGLVKTGRARIVDENTICLACPPNNINLEENKMNNNEIKKETIDLTYIIAKIDQIVDMNRNALTNADFSKMSLVPGTINPIQAICETNNNMIAFLKEIYQSMNPNNSISKQASIKEISDCIKVAITNDCEDCVEELTKVLEKIVSE